MKSPIAISLGIHLAIAIAVALGFLLRDLVPESLPLEIIEIKTATLGEKPKSVTKPVQKSQTAPSTTAQTSIAESAQPAQSETTSSNSGGDGIGPTAEDYEVSAMPVVLNAIKIPYPPSAKARGIQGVVQIDLIIDAEGRVRKADLVQGPDAELNSAALEAVKKFKFKPAEKDGKSVAVKIRYAYRFVIE